MNDTHKRYSFRKPGFPVFPAGVTQLKSAASPGDASLLNDGDLCVSHWSDPCLVYCSLHPILSDLESTRWPAAGDAKCDGCDNCDRAAAAAATNASGVAASQEVRTLP